MKQLILFSLLVLSSLAYSQTKKVFKDQSMNYSELAKILYPPKWDTIVFERIIFKADLGSRNWNDSVYGDFIISNPIKAGKIKGVEFIECTFSKSVFFEGKFEGDVSFTNCKGEELIFQNATLRESWIWGSAFTRILIENSKYKNLHISADNTQTILFKIELVGGIDISSNQIHIDESIFRLQGESLIENNGKGDSPWTNVQSSHFKQLDSGFIQFEQSNGYIQLNQSIFDGDVDFYGDGDKVTWNLIDNSFKKKVGFRSLAEIGPASYISFKEIFNDKLLGWHIEKNGETIFFDGSGKQIADERYYTNLLRLHKRLHNFYLEGGDIRTSNIVYTRIKDLETQRLIYEYNNSPSFDRWVRIALNKLLKFYTRYSTDPARAIVISIWVVFIFGIFYFFFPSSWDVSSKSKLLSDFKNLKSLDTGRYKKVISISISLTIALINAFTLSLNSFVTLGFGEIPTKGIARYMTIGEGFLGWFLLTLFSVALIGQSNF